MEMKSANDFSDDVSQGMINSKETKVKERIKVREGLADVGIPGLEQVVTTKKTNCWLRFFWFLCILGSLGGMGVFIYDRVVYFKSVPIRANVQILEASNMTFPAVTVCNKNKWDMESLWDMKREMDEEPETTMADLLDSINNMSLSDLWLEAGHKQKEVVKECWLGRNQPCNETGHWDSIFTVMGVCYTFYADRPLNLSGVFHGMYMVLEDNSTELYNETESGFKILIHNKYDNPALGVRTHGTTLPLGWGKDIVLHVTKMDTLDLASRPCNPDPEYRQYNCILRCFSDKMIRKTDCAMPYMYGRSYINNGRTCSTKDEYKKSKDVYHNLLFRGEFEPKQCTCLRQCKNTVYGTAINSEDVKPQKGPNQSRLRIYFQHMSYMSMTEENAYSLIELFTEIGGTFGLLMGASLLTFIKLAEVFICCCKEPRTS